MLRLRNIFCELGTGSSYHVRQFFVISGRNGLQYSSDTEDWTTAWRHLLIWHKFAEHVSNDLRQCMFVYPFTNWCVRFQMEA